MKVVDAGMMPRAGRPNVHYLADGLRGLGFRLPPPQSPILSIPLGEDRLLRRFSCDLFGAGVKCGSVGYPAVPHGEGLVRITVNANHTREDLDQTLDVFAALGRKYDLLNT